MSIIRKRYKKEPGIFPAKTQRRQVRELIFVNFAVLAPWREDFPILNR